MLIVFIFDWKGIIHYEFVPHGETVSKEFYLNVLKPEAWTNNTWMLHHDIALAHASLLICEFFMKRETTFVPQPPYSPNLAPADFPRS